MTYCRICPCNHMGDPLILIFYHQVLAKLACGLNKPNRQTILPLGSVAELFNSLPISKMWVPSPSRSERIDHAQHRLTRTNGRLTINLCHRITTLTRADVTSGASWASPLQRPWELRTWGTWPASLRHNWSSTLEKRQGDEMSQLFIFLCIYSIVSECLRT